MTYSRLWITTFLLLVLGVTPACNSKTPESRATPASAGNELIGAGSTFVYPLMSRWISDYQTKHPDVRINYQSIGSGGGIQQLSKGLVQFAASDMALDDKKAQEMGNPIQVAESAGPVCITYNLPNLKEPLKLSAASLAGIYLGTIKSWQSATIKRDNPGVSLPNEAIAVVHRSDGSGTSNIFTRYLSAVSPDWKSKVGQGLSVNWPVGLGGKGSEGITGIVKQTPGAIGYVELTYAETNNLPVALIQNQAKQYVKPSAESSTAAIAAFSDQLAKDIRIPIVNPPATAKDAYPISGLTYLIIPADGNDKPKRETMKSFVTYVLTDGQSVASSLHYSPIPDSLRQTDLKVLSQMKANGQPL
jgi:phosphate transport system substrate-binding protein